MALNRSYSKKANDEITYEILEECGELPVRKNGETLKLRYMTWNGGNPKYDLRFWREDEDGNERCGKGFTLTGEEVEGIYNIIGKLMED